MAARREKAESTLRPFVEHAALLVLLALIPLRAVIGETHTFEVARSLRTLDAPSGASPATTFAINALIFAVTGLVLVLRQWSGEGYRRTGAEWGAAILAVAMGISTWRAGQKHLAIIGSVDFLGFIAYFVALSQLLRRPWQVRLALTVILTTGAVMITKCAYQRFVEHPETLQYYMEHKAELISQNQSNPGFIYDYEQRLKGGSTTGFFSHPNVLASYLILVILTGLGVARARIANGSWLSAISPALIAMAGGATLIGAQSKGAAAALGIALIAWIVGERLRNFFRARPGRAVGAVWTCIVAIAVALTLTLQVKPGALGLSMLYRHFYWRASAAMIHDQGPWGVGAGNFGRFFTRYKDVECPEDVEDPHSWVVRAATEWGILGLVGLVAVLVGISRRIANQSEHKAQALWHVDKAPVLRQTLPDPSGAGVPARRTNAKSGHGGPLHSSSDTWLELPEGSLHASSIIMSSAVIGFLFFAGWFATLFDAPPPYIVITLLIPAVTWYIAYFFLAYEPAAGKSFSDAPFGPMLAALSAGLLGFVIHSGIDLAMFTGGAATTFFGLGAIGFSARRQTLANDVSPMIVREKTHHEYRTRVAVVVTEILSVSLIGLSVASHYAAERIHTARTRRENSQSMEYHRSSCGQCSSYQSGSLVYPLDGTSADERIESLLPAVIDSKDIDYLLREVDAYSRRDPYNYIIYHYRAILLARHFEIATQEATTQASDGTSAGAANRTQALSDLDLAIGCAREALAAHATSPQRHLFVADLLERRAAASDSPAERMRFNTDAAIELQTALDLDARRIYVSPLHRMTKETREAIEKRIARLKTSPTN